MTSNALVVKETMSRCFLSKTLKKVTLIDFNSWWKIASFVTSSYLLLSRTTLKIFNLNKLVAPCSMMHNKSNSVLNVITTVNQIPPGGGECTRTVRYQARQSKETDCFHWEHSLLKCCARFLKFTDVANPFFSLINYVNHCASNMSHFALAGSLETPNWMGLNCDVEYWKQVKCRKCWTF